MQVHASTRFPLRSWISADSARNCSTPSFCSLGGPLSASLLPHKRMQVLLALFACSICSPWGTCLAQRPPSKAHANPTTPRSNALFDFGKKCLFFCCVVLREDPSFGGFGVAKNTCQNFTRRFLGNSFRASDKMTPSLFLDAYNSWLLSSRRIFHGGSYKNQSAPKERRRRRHAEKRLSKRVFWRVRFFSSPKVCS